MDTQAPQLSFGNDGWHARYDADFNLANVLRMADALGVCLADAWPEGSVYVGFDTRPHMQEYAEALASTLAAYDLQVILSSCAIPTACVAWSTSIDSDAVAAVMLTASERPYCYGGILVRDSYGAPFERSFLDEIERQVPQAPSAAHADFITKDLRDAYIEELLRFVDRDAIASSELSVVVDPLNGAASTIAPQLFKAAGLKCKYIHMEEPVLDQKLQALPRDPWISDAQSLVLDVEADLGVVFDGDADRLCVIDADGNNLAPRELTPLVLQNLVSLHHMEGRVVSTTSCSTQIKRAAECFGLEHSSVPVGFARIADEIKQNDCLLATEEYGGIAIPAHLAERDALLVALLIVETLAHQSNPNLHELSASLESRIGRTLYGRRDVHLEAGVIQGLRMVLPGLNPKMIGTKCPNATSHADGLRLSFDGGAWVLLRPSRMDPIVRVYAEAPTKEERDHLLEGACELLHADFSQM